MNNKILVVINIPKLEQKFEVFLPINKKIKNVILLINKSLSEITNNTYVDKKSVLIDEETGKILNLNSTVKDAKIYNGQKLILL